MWLCVGKDVTSNSENQQPDPMGTLEKGGTNPPETGADVWSSDGTACAVAGLERGSEREAEFGAPYGTWKEDGKRERCVGR